MNKIVHLGLFLAIVSAVAGGALAFANQMTAPVIAANNEKQEKESFNMSVSGYKEGTVFLVSIDKDSKKIDKYNAISNGDTKGLGSKVTEAPFKKSLEGKNATGELDTISGATVSSGPVVSGIHEAAKLVDTLK